MNAQEILKSVKVLLGIEVKLASMNLQDGSAVLEAESFEVGFSIGIRTPEGVEVLPIGTYTLEDGTVITVEVEGIIATITPVEEVAEPEMSATPTVETPSVEGQAKKIVESIVKESFFAKNSELEAELVALKSEIEALKTEAIELAKQPSESPIKANPEPVKKAYKDMTNYEKLKFNRGEY
jgi:hypothetical protein